MIPRLFEGTATTFESGGIGWLTDCISCKVKETVNNTYALVMVYPVDGIHFSEIQKGRYIYAKPHPKGDPQIFSIYQITKPISMQVEIHAEHVSYRLRHIPVEPFTSTGASDTMSKIEANVLESCPFTFYTDITSNEPLIITVPTAAKSVLGNGDNSALGLYGGEFEYDNFDVKLLEHRGSTTGRVLRYGVDITDLSQEERIDNTITGICPYYFRNDTLVMLPEKVLHAATAANYPYQRTIPLDCSSQFESQPSVSQLRTYAEQYMVDNDIGIPEVSIKVSFVDLARVEGCDKIVGLEDVAIGDTISVEFERLGVSASAEITSYEYDVLTERYNSINIGTPLEMLTETVGGVSKVETTTIISEAVAEAKRYQKSGSKTVTLSNQTEATLLTMSELDTLFGLASGTCKNTNTVVTASNADATITTGVYGVGYSSGAWVVKFEQLVTGSVLVAYTATYYGG